VGEREKKKKSLQPAVALACHVQKKRRQQKEKKRGKVGHSPRNVGIIDPPRGRMGRVTHLIQT